MKKLLLIIICLLFLSGCGNQLVGSSDTCTVPKIVNGVTYSEADYKDVKKEIVKKYDKYLKKEIQLSLEDTAALLDILTIESKCGQIFTNVDNFDGIVSQLK